MTETHPAVAARRRRIHRIRARVAAGAAAVFIALFSGLYVQMASGDDPALRTSSAKVAAVATTSSSTGSSSSSGSNDSSPMTTSAS